MNKVIFGFVLGFVFLPIVVFLYMHNAKFPVAVADSPFPFEGRMARTAIHARIAKEMVKTPPIQASEGNLTAGAEIYANQCASCHGYKGKASSFGSHMFPDAPPLWEPHPDGKVVGVSDDPAGETYWKVSNGIRLTGMPEYKGVLSETEMWQVSLLLANADKPLPPAALSIVMGQQPGVSIMAPAAVNPTPQTPATPGK